MKRRAKDHEIAPDEIFLDASNVSDFDRSQFEGRLEKPLSRGTYVSLAIVLGLLFAILAGRAWDLQVTNGAVYAARSANNGLASETIFAPRGVIVDENGVVLADNAEGPDGSVRRVYHYPSLSQVIGYVSYPKKDSHGVYYDTKENGVTGLEAEYNASLSGANGELLTETDALGHIRSEGTVVPAQEGKTLHLTLDASLQEPFARAIADTARSEGFIAGAGVIMDVNTGAVRALVSYPSYDSEVMADGGPADVIASYNTDPGHPFLDHAIGGVYAPGSIVKPFVSSGALTDGVITPSTIIDDTGRISIPDPYHPGKEFVYTGWRALGPLDVEHAIAWSSDVFFYEVGGGYQNQKGLGIDRLDYWYRQFGLGTTTGIDLPGEAGGIVPSPAWKKETFGEPWYLGDTYFTAIGQYGMQVTPIQMARATAALVNGGKIFTPTLVYGQKTSYTTVPVDNATFSVVRSGMRYGVTNTLAQAINLPYVSVAAKTGTAQVGAKNQYDNSWVEGFFPYDHPRYAFAVVLERGPSGAGEDAVNAMRELFDSLHAANSPYVGGTGTATTTPTR